MLKAGDILRKTNLIPRAANAQHRGRRENQEDSFGFSQFSDLDFTSHGGYVSVVADGMGGLENGAQASITALRTFLSAYQEKSPKESVLDALQRAAVEANAEVFREAASLSAIDRMGSTLIAAAVIENRLEWVSVGDSRLYHSSGGIFRQLSEDHNFGRVLADQVAQGIITEDEAIAHPKAHALTSYLGREQIPFMSTSQTGAVKLRQGDWVVLCSDGLSGTLSSEEISKELHGNVKEASEHLLLRALSKDFPHQDNITLLVLRIDKQTDTLGASVRKKSHQIARVSLGGIAVGAAAMLLYLLLPMQQPSVIPIAPTITPSAQSGVQFLINNNSVITAIQGNSGAPASETVEQESAKQPLPKPATKPATMPATKNETMPKKQSVISTSKEKEIPFQEADHNTQNSGLSSTAGILK